MTDQPEAVIREALTEGRDWALKDYDEYSIAIFEPALDALDTLVQQRDEARSELDRCMGSIPVHTDAALNLEAEASALLARLAIAEEALKRCIDVMGDSLVCDVGEGCTDPWCSADRFARAALNTGSKDAP